MTHSGHLVLATRRVDLMAASTRALALCADGMSILLPHKAWKSLMVPVVRVQTFKERLITPCLSLAVRFFHANNVSSSRVQVDRKFKCEPMLSYP